ncbi:MAG: ABC transporter substrate-binding protein [Clostridia bacterium]|nr:ABC transporter substrate-binding protein [Clostridia bacterium]
MSVIKRVLIAFLCVVFVLSLFGCRGNLKSGELIIEEGASEINLAVFDIDTLNPVRTKSQSVSEMLSLIYEPLFTFDEKLNPIPCLAKSALVSSDGLSVKIVPETGIMWHSGTSFVADDIVYTVNEIKNGESVYKHNVKAIEEMAVDTDGSVVMTLREPVMNIEGLLSFPIIRNGSSAEIGEMPDGTGAFSVKEKNATSIQLTANKYREKSSVSAVNVSIMRNAAACLNAFEANELDLITSAAVDLGEKTPAGDIEIHQYTSNRMTFLGFNCALEKYKTPYLRLAMSGIIDREKIVEKALFGRGAVCRLPFNPVSSIYTETDGPEIDISGAFSKAGYTKINGMYLSETGEQVKADILVSQDSARKVSVAQMLAEQLEAEGVDVSVTVIPYDNYLSRIDTKEYDMFIGDVTMSDNLCPDFLTADGNFFGYFDQQMSDAVYAMKSAKGDALKNAMLDYERVFTINPPFAPLYFSNDGVVYKKNISGITEPNFYNCLTGLDKMYLKAVK